MKNLIFYLFSGTKWFLDDDDAEWETAVYIGQCSGVPGPFDGECS